MPVKAGVVRAGERTTKQGSPDTFTGTVFQDPVITANSPSRLGGSVVTFTPGARTAWHAHPVGQTLYCLTGVGRICFQGEQPQAIYPGDTVNIPPNTMHWHGASPDRLFSHLALSEAGGVLFLVLEARERAGGRAWTADGDDGFPMDLGCEWLHSADRNALVPLAEELGFSINTQRPDWTTRLRHSGESEAAEADWLA